MSLTERSPIPNSTRPKARQMILDLLADGMTEAEIANEVGASIGWTFTAKKNGAMQLRFFRKLARIHHKRLPDRHLADADPLERAAADTDWPNQEMTRLEAYPGTALAAYQGEEIEVYLEEPLVRLRDHLRCHEVRGGLRCLGAIDHTKRPGYKRHVFERMPPLPSLPEPERETVPQSDTDLDEPTPQQLESMRIKEPPELEAMRTLLRIRSELEKAAEGFGTEFTAPLATLNQLGEHGPPLIRPTANALRNRVQNAIAEAQNQLLEVLGEMGA